MMDENQSKLAGFILLIVGVVALPFGLTLLVQFGMHPVARMRQVEMYSQLEQEEEFARMKQEDSLVRVKQADSFVRMKQSDSLVRASQYDCYLWDGNCRLGAVEEYNKYAAADERVDYLKTLAGLGLPFIELNTTYAAERTAKCEQQLELADKYFGKAAGVLGEYKKRVAGDVSALLDEDFVQYQVFSSAGAEYLATYRSCIAEK